MTRGRTVGLLLLILAAAALLRFTGLAWGLPSWFHPDERAIVMKAQELTFDDLNPHWFPYGSLPLYLLRGVTATLAAAGVKMVDPAMAGRALSALLGVATVLLVFPLARRPWGDRAGLLAAAFLAVAMTHVQNSHYYTVDVPLTFFTTLSLVGATRLAGDGRLRHALLAGAALGLALACKVSALPLLLPLLLAAWLGRGEGGRRRAGVLLAAGVAAAAAAFLAAMPYALLDCRTFWRDVAEQGRMASGAAWLPYTLQFKGTIPYLYPLEQLVRWSLGWPLGLVTVAGLLAAPFATRQRGRTLAVLSVFLVPFVAVNAGLYAKYPRYLLPAIPALLAVAAGWLVTLRDSRRPLARLGGSVLPWAALIPAAAGSVALLHVFTAPNPRVAASDYLHTYHPMGARILVEHWDDRVPVTTTRGRSEDFTYVELPLYEPDTLAKWRSIAGSLESGDVVVLASQRLAGSLPRDPRRYPIASNYHRALLAGDLGYRVEAVFTTYPRLLGVHWRDDLADESIRVYDHPTVVVLVRAAAVSADEIIRRLEQPSELARRWDLTALRSIAPVNPTAIAWEEGAGEVPDSSSPMPFTDWGGQALAWVLLLGIAGPVAFPLVAPFFRGLPDGGWAIARVAGPFLTGSVVWAGAARGWWGFTPLACWVAAAVLFAASRAVAVLSPVTSDPLAPSRRPLVAAGEAVFWSTLLGFLLFKAYNPAVFWGEKPMNLSYLGSLLRSSQVPPPDPWFAGEPLNYYHLGHFFAALPAKMLGTDPTIAFNLASAAIPALVAVTLFSLAAALAGAIRWGLVGAAFAVFLGNGAAVVELVRRGVEQGWGRWTQWVNFDYFWAPSRVIPGTINEFPYWAFLFSDLHAHLLVMPLWGMLLLCGYHLFASLASGARLREARVAGPMVLCGVAVAATYGVNPWSLPGTLLVLLLTTAAGGAAGGGWRGALRGAAGMALGIVVGAAVFLPYLRSYESPVSGVHLVGSDTSPTVPFLLIWGYLAAILLVWLAVVSSRRRPVALLAGWLALVAAGTAIALRLGVDLGPLLVAGSGAAVAGVAAVRERGNGRRYALLLAAFGLALLAGCEVVFVDSRFNSVFKFHLQAWFPLAAAGAVALAEIPRHIRPRGASRWVVLSLFGAATICWFSFAVTGTRGKLVDDKSIAGELPTLDGMEFLRRRDADEWRALTWLRRYAAGSPVVAEAQGPTYREYARVAMYTGLPSVLGWDYHLSQQGRDRGRIDLRKEALRTVFSGVGEAEISRLGREYGISLVYVGGVERRDFGPGVGDRFAPLLPSVFSSGTTTIHELYAGGAPVRVRMSAPSSAAPAAPASTNSPAGNLFTGGRGDAPGLLHEPRGIAIAPGGELLVADFGNARVQRFSPEGSFEAAYGGRGAGPGRMNDPCGVAVGADGTIYLLDTWNARVQVLDAGGAVIDLWEGPSPGFYGPRGIAWSPDGVAVADTGNNRVVLFDLDGTFRSVVSATGPVPADLALPVGVAWDNGKLVVVDSGNNRLVVLSDDGRPLRTLPLPGWTGKGLKEAYVAVAPDGRYLVTDPVGSALLVVDPSGKGAQRVPVPGGDMFPTGIAVGPDGSAFVVATHQDRVVRVAFGPP